MRNRIKIYLLESPEIIPDEDPFENPVPFEIPPPAEGP